MSWRPRTFGVGLAALPALSLALIAQTAPPGASVSQAQQPPVFRGGTAVVPIDLHVLDRLGRPVTDLKASEISILEDGVPQELRHFATVALQPQSPSTVDRPSGRPSLGRDLVPPRRRVFLIVLGRGRLQEPAKGIDALLRFVRERVLPQDLVGLLAYDRATDFTTDHARIAQVIDRYRTRHEGIEQDLRSHFSGLSGVYGSKLLPAAIRADIDDVFRIPGAPLADREAAPAPVASEDRLTADTRRAVDARLGLALPASLSAPDGDMVESSFDAFVASNRQTMQDLGNLYTGIEYLRQIDGEKHLLFLTEQGLTLPRLDSDRSLAALASDARVAIDSIVTGGIADTRDPRTAAAGPAPGVVARQAAVAASLRTMAELTGGQSSVNTYAEATIDRINAATRTGYLLGYTPTNAAWTGEYRRITLSTTRADLTLLYRHGYYGRPDPAPLDRRQLVATSRMNAAAGYRRDIRDIALRARAEAVRESAHVRVEVTVAVTRLHLEDAAPDRVAAFDIVLLCLDGNQRVVGQAAEAVKLRLDPGALARAREDGWVYTAHVPRPASARSVKVVVYDYAADLLGSTVALIK
jgi:VWFA-related protein